ncbi:MAG: hypothetical protein PHP35_03065 [Candidatus Colwellbacteria bacterium]|nr:hypothetical protein [Candidatus Colwellbacteria bacterium]
MDYKTLDEFKEGSGYLIEDVWYPRVTSIVSIKAKPALYRYYAGLKNFEEGEKIKQQSADEGTLVHEAVQAVMRGEEPELTEVTKPAVEAYMKFLENNSVEVDANYIERRIINHDERYSGTCDAVAIIGGKMGILDIKTSQAIYRDYCLQTSAYVEPLRHELKDLSTRWILRVDQSQSCRKCGATRRTKGGKEKIRTPWNNPYAKFCVHEWSETKGEIELKEFTDFDEDYRAFLGAKALWEWEHIDWLKQIGYK